MNRIEILKTNLAKIKRVEDTGQRDTILDKPGVMKESLSVRKALALDTFPKPGVPIPLEIRVANLDSSDRKMCSEILSLTKLNWNNADFCDQKPITLVASEHVKDILSEARIQDIELISQYRYYI